MWYKLSLNIYATFVSLLVPAAFALIAVTNI
jgi:hypothetical protein